jgi:hypothetical protein
MSSFAQRKSDAYWLAKLCSRPKQPRPELIPFSAQAAGSTVTCVPERGACCRAVTPPDGRSPGGIHFETPVDFDYCFQLAPVVTYEEKHLQVVIDVENVILRRGLNAQIV